MSSQTAGGIFERQNSFRKTSLKLSEPNSAFETLNGDSWNVLAMKLKQGMVNTESLFRWDFMILLCRTYFYLENHQSTLFKTGRKDFHNELVEKIFSGYPPSGSKMLLHEHMKKRERSMLLFKLDTSHARMGLLLPRSGSRVNKSQLPDESLKDSEPLCELHFAMAL